MKVKIDTKTVVENFRRALELARDVKPLIAQIVGGPKDSKPWTIRGSIARSFIQKQDPKYKTWPALKESTVKSKNKNFPGTSTLIATGDLFNSLIQKSKGSVYIMNGPKLTYGTSIPYAQFHMTGTENMEARPFIGVTPQQARIWKKLIRDYFKAAMEGDKPEKVKV